MLAVNFFKTDERELCPQGSSGSGTALSPCDVPGSPSAKSYPGAFHFGGALPVPVEARANGGNGRGVDSSMRFDPCR